MEDTELNKLYNEYEKYIDITINKRFNNPSFWELHGLTLDDLYQLGRIGLHSACETYDSGKGSEFLSYVINKIQWSINSGCKTDSLSRVSGWSFEVIDRTSLDLKVSEGDGEDYTLHDIVSDGINIQAEVEFQEKVENLLDKLKPKVAEIVELKAMGYSNEKVGEILNVSHQYVSRMLRENKEKIKNLLLV